MGRFLQGHYSQTMDILELCAALETLSIFTLDAATVQPVLQKAKCCHSSLQMPHMLQQADLQQAEPVAQELRLSRVSLMNGHHVVHFLICQECFLNRDEKLQIAMKSAK